MRNLIFNDLSILSMKERTAKRIPFDPKTTTIIGGNGTGKSSVVKSIYWTLGAEPAVIHQRWRAIDPVCLLSLTYNNNRIRVLRYKNVFAIFENGTALPSFVFKRITNGLSNYFASFFNYHLILADKSEAAVQSPPTFLFLPFYVDQDEGWRRPLKSFGRTEYLKAPLLPTLEYHTGIRPDQYYVLKAKEDQTRKQVDELSRELRAMRTAQERVSAAMPSVDFSLDVTEYREEIDRLLVECNRLRSSQEKYRQNTNSLRGDLDELLVERRLAQEAIKELREDYVYANEQEDDVLCPTCGTHYENSIVERFRLAADEESLELFSLELLSKIADIESSLQNELKEYNKVTSQLTALEQVLDEKKGELSLREIILAEGRRSVREAFGINVSEHQLTLGGLAASLEGIKDDIRKLEDSGRKKEVMNTYRSLMGSFLSDLDVTSVVESQYKRLDADIKETGSVRPRTTLAYQFALLHTIARHGTSTLAPIVIDSPNQQALDQVNLRKVLRFVYKHQPEGQQLIIALEETLGLNIPGKHFTFNKKEQVLEQAEFSSLSEEILPMLENALSTKQQ